MSSSASHSTPRYDRLHFVLGQGDQGEATIVRDSLKSRGVGRVAECAGSTERLFKTLDSEIVDLIVYDFELLRDRFADVMQMVRRKSRGLNPFTIIVATVDDSDMETVQRLVKAGVDDMIRRPVTGQRLFESISNLMDQRKPFVVAHDYVGPSRRLDRRTDLGGDKLMRVPNTMRSRAIDNVSEDELQRMVDTAVANLRDRQLVACGVEVDNQAKRLVEVYGAFKASPTRADDVRKTLHRLQELADDLHGRCAGGPYERIGDLATMVVALTQRIERASPGQAATEVQLLAKLAASIQRAVSVERDSVGVMTDIANTIAGYTGRKH